ncbi:MAG: sensor histidine kinase [Acidobacteriota bacterium]
MRQAAPKLRRQYLLAASLFAALLLATFALFFHLLTGQLSRSYLEDILLSGRVQAEELARQMRGEGPLYKVVESRRRALARISAAVAHQEIVDSVRVYDNRGKLVWQTQTRTEGVSGAFPEANNELVTPPSEPKVVETTNSYEIRVPLEDLGTVVYSQSKAAIATRIAILRHRLLLHTAVAAGAAMLLLIGAIGFIWHLVQRNAQLERRRRLDEELATLGSLAANLAHEIRNPLNALSLNLELLEEDLSDRRVGTDSVGLARREVGRLSRLVNDFLVYARPAPPAVEETDACELLDDTARLLAPVCEKANVELRVDRAPVKVNVDRSQMGQVLVNLALNSVQAMEGSRRRQLTLRCGREGGRTMLEVIDSGPGIPAPDLSRVRDAFYTSRKGGTGLGLAIADRIVGAHGGSLELENRPEGGLVARIVLAEDGNGAKPDAA